jgi:hypothetical protein
MDKVMLSLTNFAAEMEREKARQRTYDAMLGRPRLCRSRVARSMAMTTSRSSLSTAIVSASSASLIQNSQQ